MSSISTLQSRLLPHQGLLLSLPSDITYISHFHFLVPEEREAFVFLTSQQKYLIKSSFSPFANDDQFTVLANTLPAATAQHLRKIVEEQHISEILVDETSLFLHEYNALEDGLGEYCTIHPLDRQMMWELRMIKQPPEIDLLQQSARIIMSALEKTRKNLQAGMTEYAVAQQLADEIRTAGGDDVAFPTIVAFGDHSAYPHHQPTQRILKEGTVILIDCGAKLQGYRSDVTRTWWFGAHVPDTFRRVETVIHQAYDAALRRLSEPALAKDIDDAARQGITSAGYADQFIHSTGHGVGLDLHEPPSLNWKCETALATNMVFTIEPGIYLPGEFGYRYENTIHLTPHGAKELTME